MPCSTTASSTGSASARNDSAGSWHRLSSKRTFFRIRFVSAVRWTRNDGSHLWSRKRIEMAALPFNLADRVRGMLTAAAVGDALGWPQELRSNIVGGQKARAVQPQPRFRSWERNSGTQYARYQETVNAGEYSDDTQLLLAVARSCLSGKEWLPRLTGAELPTWLLYHRGAGRAVISAARAWADGHPPWERGSERGRSGDPVAQYFQAGANGAAMRIAPHAVITAAQDTSAMLN